MFSRGKTGDKPVNWNHNRINSGSNGVFVFYGNPGKEGFSIIVQRDGLYYKSGIISGTGHSEIVVNLGSREWVTARLKDRSKGGGVYLFANNSQIGYLRFDKNGILKISYDSDFVLSATSDVKQGIKVAGGRIGRNVYL